MMEKRNLDLCWSRFVTRETMEPTLRDIPLEIIKEIIDNLDSYDTIALRLVCKANLSIPVRLGLDLQYIKDINQKTLMRYQQVDEMSCATEWVAKWFFGEYRWSLGGTYNNIKILNVAEAHYINGALPRSLEKLYIGPGPNPDRQNTIDLHGCPRLCRLVCKDPRVTFINIPRAIIKAGVHLSNVPPMGDPRGLPVTLKFLKIRDDPCLVQPNLTSFTSLLTISIDNNFILSKQMFPPSIRKIKCTKTDIPGVPRNVPGKLSLEGNWESIWSNPEIAVREFKWCYVSNIDRFSNIKVLHMTGATINIDDPFKSLSVLKLQECTGSINVKAIATVKTLEFVDSPFLGIWPGTIDLRLLCDVAKYRKTIDLTGLDLLKSLRVVRTMNHSQNYIINNNQQLTDLKFERLGGRFPLPSSLETIQIHEGSWFDFSNLPNLKHLQLTRPRTSETIKLPRELKTLYILSGIALLVDVSHLSSLRSISLNGVNMIGDLPISIMEVSLHSFYHDPKYVNLKRLHIIPHNPPKYRNIPVYCIEDE